MTSRDRPEWIKCIQKTKNVSWCGRDIYYEFHFINLDHALANIKSSRLVPCKKCLELARGERDA